MDVDWIAQRADELANIQYGKDFYSLSDETQQRLWIEATEEYADREASRADVLYDAECERRIGL